MAREVDLTQYAEAHAAGGVTVDVREPWEYVEGHVPGARLVPLMELAQHVGSLPTDQPVYVICAVGQRSLAAADFLTRGGVDAYSVAGGTAGWAHLGRELVTGTDPG